MRYVPLHYPDHIPLAEIKRFAEQQGCALFSSGSEIYLVPKADEITIESVQKSRLKQDLAVT